MELKKPGARILGALFAVGLLASSVGGQTAMAHPRDGGRGPGPEHHHGGGGFGGALAGGLLGGVIGGAIMSGGYGYGYNGPYNYYNGYAYPYGYTPYPMNYGYTSPTGVYLEYQQYQAVPAITRCGYDPYGNYACLRVQ